MKRAEGRASEARNWSVVVSYAEPDEHNVLFDGTFADVRRDAQRRRSAYLGALIAPALATPQ